MPRPSWLMGLLMIVAHRHLVRAAGGDPGCLPIVEHRIAVAACHLPARVVSVLVARAVGRPQGPIESLRYSAHLVRGNWWRTVMVYLVVLTMIIVLSVTAGLIVGVLTQLVAARDLAVAPRFRRDGGCLQARCTCRLLRLCRWRCMATCRRAKKAPTWSGGLRTRPAS